MTGRESCTAGRIRRGAVVVSTAVCLLLGGCGKDAERAEPTAEAPGAPLAGEERGKELFQKHCSGCHGEQGLGDGPAAYLLYPQPRDFSRGVFRIVTTSNGIPSDDDLFGVVSRGMPGSAMPSWEHVPETDRRALVAEVRRLIRNSGADRLMREAEEADDPMTREEALAFAGRAPGRLMTLPAEVPATPKSAEWGKELYAERCAECHDEDGRGRKKLDMKDSFGFPIRARDFQEGIFKGGASQADIAYRLLAGMPGTPMPKMEIPADELWALVQHARTFIRPGAQERVEQKRRTLRAERVTTALSADPADSVWASVPSTYVALMPLRWRSDRIDGVEVRARHDGEKLALHLTWQDPTRDQSVARQTDFTDGAAVQLSADPTPPFFAMGDKDGVVDIWHWKAAWEVDVASGYRDVQDAFPRMVVNLYDSLSEPPFGRYSPVSEFPASAHKRVFMPGWGAGNPLSDPERASRAERLVARGFGTLTSAPRASQALQAQGAWTDGVWRLVFVRPLDSGPEADVTLAPGGVVAIGLAIWDGRAGDRDGEKSVTIWHELVLEK